jgi:CRP-like cAMP-binding protein
VTGEAIAAPGAAPAARPTFFDRLPPVDRVALLVAGIPRRYPANTMLFVEGDDPSAVHVIRSGLVKVSATIVDRDVVLDVLGGGDLVGELSVIDERPRSATAITMVPTDLVAVPAAAFRRFLVEHPACADALLRSLAGRVRDASRRQAEYGALDAVGRVCRRLVEMMERFGDGVGDEVVIGGPLTQVDIAAWAGLSREAVVKALHAMRRLGWVRTDVRSIAVLDAAAVRARAAVPVV